MLTIAVVTATLTFVLCIIISELGGCLFAPFSEDKKPSCILRCFQRSQLWL